MADHRSIWPNWHQEKIYAVFMHGILFVVFLGAIVWVLNGIKTFSVIGRAPVPERTIAVSGEGKVQVRPDVATIDLGVVSQKTTQEAAVTEATNKMNAVVSRLRALGISENDLQTQQYTVYPRYDYPNGRQVASGFEAQQRLTVRVRNQQQMPQVLKVGTDEGANQIGDLRYTIDDPEPLRAQARQKAIASANAKARQLASSVGVRLGRVVAFDESSSEGVPSPYPYYARDAVGGSVANVPTPDVQPGSQDVYSTVTLTFEIY